MQAHGPKRWFSFNGRAQRLEFVNQSAIALAVDLITRALCAVAVQAGVGGWTPGALGLLVTFLSIVASWAVMYRRLHDLGFSGRVVLIPLLCVGGILGFVAWRTRWEPPAMFWNMASLAGAVLLSAIPGAPGANRFGPAPGVRELPAAPEEAA